jgi:hypothetical protein
MPEIQHMLAADLMNLGEQFARESEYAMSF